MFNCAKTSLFDINRIVDFIITLFRVAWFRIYNAVRIWGNCVSQNRSGAGSSPAGSVGWDLNL